MSFNYPLLLVASDDPYPTYKWMRDEDPAHYSETEDVWVLTRFADCSAAFRGWKTWSSERRGNLLNDIPERVGKTLGTSDPPKHTFARSIVNKAFTPRTVANLQPTVRTLAQKLCTQAREAGAIEFVAAISAPYNAAILGAMFGVPEQEFIQLRGWLDDFFKREKAPAGEEPRQVVAMRQLRHYLSALAEQRQTRPGEDLMSAMLLAEDGGQRLAVEQVIVTTMTFLTAGFESTNNLFTNLAYALALHPQVLAEVQAQPELVPAFVEEGMRWDAAAQGFVRSPTQDVALHGKVIPQGAQVLLHIGSANRDEREFAEADRFDIHRPDQRHLGMGQGIHFCVGAALGRAMAQFLFEELLAVSTRWDVDLSAAARVTTPNFRGFVRLPLTIN
ncbi:MAG: cytochrome P450 [Chloroflexi bacterium]|nr:cytochrome P450 [Chloroflexota bacterium]MCI0650021.1 cytochrome P450 [Chloroflexota bacterium]MCI0730495.1 cytochrome P450 [Chloroflexota bacterium]